MNDAPTPGGHRRTHPITPLVTGWKVVVGVIAVIAAQNVAQLIDEFTVSRALIGAGLLVVAVIIAIAFSLLSWWFTTYAVDDEGVALHKGLISRSRQFAPRARIESVSVERPLLARVLGLAKVRVEVAGGGGSYVDIEYIRSEHAEELRSRILQVAGLSRVGAHGPSSAAEPDTATSEPGLGAEESAALPAAPPGPGQILDTGTSGATGGTGASGAEGLLPDALRDDITDGEPIAAIPAGRLLRSLLRDADFLLGILVGIVGVAAAIAMVAWTIWGEGTSLAGLIALVPAFIAVPKYVLGRIETGWGFVSRITDRGLRMRRGLLNTRTDNIASGRIQRFALKRPLLWRGPGWTSVAVTVAGIEDSGENGAENALPVGTREELALTVGHLAVPLGTDDDLATIEHLLTARARSIDGLRAPHPVFWISRRTRVTVLLPGAVIHRSGVLAKRLEIIPRERIQTLTIDDDPFSRRLGVFDLKVGVAGHTTTLSALPRKQALELHAVLAQDAATLRRYRNRASWPQPALTLGGSAR